MAFTAREFVMVDILLVDEASLLLIRSKAKHVWMCVRSRQGHLPWSNTFFTFVNSCLHSGGKGSLAVEDNSMTMSGLTAMLQLYAVSLWYDFIVDSPLAVPKVIHLSLQYMTLSYVQIFHQIFIHSILVVKTNYAYLPMLTGILK